MNARQLRDKVIQMGSCSTKKAISGYISNLKHQPLNNLFELYNNRYDFQKYQKEMWAFEIARRYNENEIPNDLKLEAILITGEYLWE